MEPILVTIRNFWHGLQAGQLPELGAWSYVVLSVLIVIQGPISTLLGGAAAAAGMLKPALVLVAGAIGNLTADIVWYHVGAAGKLPWLLSRNRFFRIRQDRLQALDRSMHQHGRKILLLAKLSAGFAVPALIAAGITKLRWRQWFPVVFVGETIWTGSLVLLGYVFCNSLAQAKQGMELFMAGTSIALLLLISACFLPAILNRRQAQ